MDYYESIAKENEAMAMRFVCDCLWMIIGD